MTKKKRKNQKPKAKPVEVQEKEEKEEEKEEGVEVEEVAVKTNEFPSPSPSPSPSPVEASDSDRGGSRTPGSASATGGVSGRTTSNHEEVVALVNQRLDQAIGETKTLVSALGSMLSVNLGQTERFLNLHKEASEEVAESARVAVGMTHGLVESCMQVNSDGKKLVEETKSKISAIKKQIDGLEQELTKAGVL